MAGPDEQMFDERRRMDSHCPIFMIWFFVDRIREFGGKSNNRHVHTKNIFPVWGSDWEELVSKESLMGMVKVKD